MHWLLVVAIWIALLLYPLLLMLLVIRISRRCPGCGCETLPLRIQALRFSRGWLTWRWCLCCGWTGLVRKPLRLNPLPRLEVERLGRASDRIRALLLPLPFMLAAQTSNAQQDSLDLSSALALARARSPTLAMSAAGLAEAGGSLTVARSAGRPRVGMDALYLRYQDPPSASLGPLGSFAPFLENGYLLELRATQPLYTGGRVRQAVRAAEWAGQAAGALHEQGEVEVTAAVAHAHDDALLARDLVGVAEKAEATLRSAVRVAEEHHRAGTVARLDVLRAETRLASAQSALRAAKGAAAAARERLAALIGVDPTAPPPVAGRLEYLSTGSDRLHLGPLLARARDARPDVAAWRATAEAHEARAAGAGAGRLPSVALYLSSLTTRPELVTGEERWAWEWLGGVYVSWPFFDSGAARGEAQAERAGAARARAEAEQAARMATAGVLAHHREMDQAREDIGMGQENAQRAEHALAIAQERYADGVGIQLEVLEAEADLTQVRADLLRAIHAYRGAAIELRRATGSPADASLAGSAAEEDR